MKQSDMGQAKHKLRTGYLQDSLIDMYQNKRIKDIHTNGLTRTIRNHPMTKHLINCRDFNDHLIYMYKKNKELNESIPNYLVKPIRSANKYKLVVHAGEFIKTNHYFDTNEERNKFHDEIMELYSKYNIKKREEPRTKPLTKTINNKYVVVLSSYGESKKFYFFNTADLKDTFLERVDKDYNNVFNDEVNNQQKNIHRTF